ncbi:zinc-dependent alcohol dehydrogenase family protein [Cyclobacterium jeungdonense]|uniref:alcohol dehydrogenase n=1 Tax=Cyclobacterium jeungdonense TaxID=708087 RepID=A0ABT8CCP2_9BACT|nr:zinc-dependent alcohol dehydrogenase family protein [Cyclobacterium jeungdonense]MDN3690167.1 zinc-dependent alcohol dehydrogenase family protein [Cyclobacterium jeungdonense]
MKAWLLNGISNLDEVSNPLELAEVPMPEPKDFEIRIKVSCCGICHTELDEIEGRTPPGKYPIIPGHQVVGIVEKCGNQTQIFKDGDRVGVAWIFGACGQCEYCVAGLENLCPEFRATGRDRNGGYAQFMVVDERFAYRIPSTFSDVEAAPLLCAGAIGYRSLRLTGISDGQTLGLTGFGASGHLVMKMSLHMYPKSPVYVFARNKGEQQFARDLGATWAGQITDSPPQDTNAIIDTTPVWTTVVGSLLHLKPGGRLIINAIRKESNDLDALLKISYQDHLWMEKEIKSVANITRSDVFEFLNLAASIPIKPAVVTYPFSKANKAIMDLKQKHVKGAKVLVVN